MKLCTDSERWNDEKVQKKKFYQDFCTLLSLCVEFGFYEVFIDWTKTNSEYNSNYSCLVKTLNVVRNDWIEIETITKLH